MCDRIVVLNRELGETSLRRSYFSEESISRAGEKEISVEGSPRKTGSQSPDEGMSFIE